MHTSCTHLFFQQTEYIRNQISVRHRVIHPNRYRHQKFPVFLTIFSPVDDGQEIREPIRQFDIQGVIGYPLSFERLTSFVTSTLAVMEVEHLQSSVKCLNTPFL